MNVSNHVNRKYQYEFELHAITPLYIGEREQGEILRDANDQPFIAGNSIGGALRDYLVRSGMTYRDIISIMGGDLRFVENSEQEVESQGNTFKESRIYISDGKISANSNSGFISIVQKEGTRINPKHGSAQEHHKYSFLYIPAGFLLTFKVEFDCMPDKLGNDSSVFICGLMKQWARAINKGDIQFGGKKSSDFGKFHVKQLYKTSYSFLDQQAIDNYIFFRHGEKKYEQLSSNDWLSRKPIVFDNQSAEEQLDGMNIHIELKGHFPFGVYQSFELIDKQLDEKLDTKQQPYITLSGLQQVENKNTRYIPASSMKGLMRHQFALLVQRILLSTNNTAADKENFIKQCCDELFGSTEQVGQLVVSDFTLSEDQSVYAYRAKPSNDNQSGQYIMPQLPRYNKIDRLTGGVLGSALKTQYEAAGAAIWKVELKNNRAVADTAGNYDVALDQSPFIFPIIYIMRQIGMGKVPVGGRTAVGLGQFEATELQTTLKEAKISQLHSSHLSKNNEERLRQFYQVFREWIEEKLIGQEELN